MQYTHPDIMYAVNHLFGYADAQSKPEFQVIKFLIGYLSELTHHTIMYSSGLDDTINN